MIYETTSKTQDWKDISSVIAMLFIDLIYYLLASLPTTANMKYTRQLGNFIKGRAGT